MRRDKPSVGALACLLAALCLFAGTAALYGQDLGSLGQEGLRLEAAGDYQGAKDVFGRGLELALKMHHAEAVAIFRAGLGQECLRLGQLAEAKGALGTAVAEIEKLGTQRAILSSTLASLGIVHTMLDEQVLARDVLKKAVQVAREEGDLKGAADALLNLAVAERHLDSYPAALSDVDQAIEIEQQRGDARRTATAWLNRAEIYSDIGLLKDAIGSDQEALRISREIKDGQGIRHSLASLGLSYGDLGDDDQALEAFQEAQQIKVGPGEPENIGYVENNLALFYKRQGQNSKAEALLREALKAEQVAGLPPGIIEGNLGDLELEKGNTREAVQHFIAIKDLNRLAYAYLKVGDLEKASQYFEYDLKAALLKNAFEFVFDDLEGLGQVALARKDQQGAERYFQRAIDLSEEQREDLPPGQRTLFFGASVRHCTRVQAYWGKIKALMAQGKPEEALACSEALKGRVLAEAMTRESGFGGSKLPEALAEEETRWRAELMDLKLRKKAAQREGLNQQVETLGKQLDKVRAGQRAFIGRLRRLQGAYAALHYPQSIQYSELRLGATEALLEFQVTEDRTYAFLSYQGKLQTREIPMGQEELSALVEKWRRPFQGARDASDLAAFDPELGISLGQKLLGDWAETLKPGIRLVVVPDDSLALLPFEALVLAQNGKAALGQSAQGPFPLGLSYLGERFTLTYAQSATSLALLRARPKPASAGHKVIVVCDPVFSESDARAKGSPTKTGEDAHFASAVKQWQTLGVAGIRDKGQSGERTTEPYFPRLEKTAAVGDDLTALFGDDCELYCGLEANKTRLDGASWSQCRYAVFATHGILDGSLPYIRQPALVLSQIGPDREKEGFLTMSQVSGMQLPAEAVVLTACETGLGRKVSGEGVMGMGRAFQAAGAESVLMSLWEVSEDASVALTSAFFKQLKAGQKAPQALNLARQEIRRQGYENPFFWASFILVSP